jgi:2-dehydropantoate 2-reductase
MGELDRTRSERVARIVEALEECGVQAIQAEDIHVALWVKFLFIAPFAAVGSLSRANIGEILACPETRALLIGAIEEVDAVARKQGIRVSSEAAREALALMESLEPTATTSMQRDVAAGRAFELEAFSGAIARMGRELSVGTPIHATAYALLRPALERAIRARPPDSASPNP